MTDNNVCDFDEYVFDDEPTCEADAVRLRQREHLAELLKLCEMGRAAIHGERSNVLDSYQWSMDEIPF